MTTTDPFRIVVEPDGDAWHAYCPALEKHGAATWGETRDEALENIRQVVELVVADLLEGRRVEASLMYHGQVARLTRLVRRRAERI